MSDYYPPSENLPIFDVNAFRTTNDNNITQDDADRMYLSRQGVASSLANSTNFLGTLACGGNLTLNAPIASNRQIQGSFLKLQDNASISTNKPMIWNPDPSLQITTNDFLGTLKTIDLKSYDGTATNLSTSLSCQYAQVSMKGTLKIEDVTITGNTSTISTVVNNFIINNPIHNGNIVLKADMNQGGSGIISLQATNVIQYNCPIAPQIGSNPSTNMNYIGGTSIITGSNLGIVYQNSAILNSTSITLVPGVYTLIGQVHYYLTSSFEITWKYWGCFFNSVINSLSTTVGSPYTISTNTFDTRGTNNTSINGLNAGSGMKMQSVMNINLTTTTQIFLNLVCEFVNSTNGFPNTINAYSSIMVTRIA